MNKEVNMKYKGVECIPIWVFGGDPVAKPPGIGELIIPLENVAGAQSAILQIQVPHRKKWALVSAPVFMKIFDSSGNELREDTEFQVIFRGAPPYAERSRVANFTYGVRYFHTWYEQWGKEREHPRKLWRALELNISSPASYPSLAARFGTLNGVRIFQLSPDERIQIVLKSNQIVDWSNQNTKIYAFVHEEPTEW